MDKEKLIKEYNKVTKKQGDLTIKIFDLMTELYEKRIFDSKTVEELDVIKNEISKEWPNTVGSFNDKTVSSQHARLAYHHNQWWVEDLGSMNGTYLNQEIITVPTVITNGDQLRCGLVTFEVLLETNS